MSLIKSTADIALLRDAGKKLAEVLDMAEKNTKAGMTLLELDTSIHDHILSLGCRPSFLGFDGFPNASCLSVNEVVVHGIPNDYIIKDGDLVGIDAGLWLEHVCVDGAKTVAVGEISPEATQLLEHTQEALAAGIKAAKPFRRVGSISSAVQEVGEKYGHGVVRSLTGHGVGHQVHEDPEVPNLGKPSDGIILRPGMVLAIEPMFTNGSGDVETEINGWGVVTSDCSLSAQFEHTVVITQKGAEILTKL
jgi:methionyl aminopeptidase